MFVAKMLRLVLERTTRGTKRIEKLKKEMLSQVV